jgi:hypothetical protein
MSVPDSTSLPYRDQAKVAFRAAKEESLVRFHREDSDNPDAVAWHDSWYETCCGQNWITGYAAALATEQSKNEQPQEHFVPVHAADLSDVIYRVQNGGMRQDWRDDVLMRLEHAVNSQPTVQAKGPIEITDEMVERALKAWDETVPDIVADPYRNAIRAALEAAINNG